MSTSIYILRVSWIDKKWFEEHPAASGNFPNPKIGNYAIYYHNDYVNQTLTTTPILRNAAIWDQKFEAKEAAKKHNEYAKTWKVEVVHFKESGVYQA